MRRREELLDTGAYDAGDLLLVRIQERLEELMAKGSHGDKQQQQLQQV
jgi:hypothetical protein